MQEALKYREGLGEGSTLAGPQVHASIMHAAGKAIP